MVVLCIVLMWIRMTMLLIFFFNDTATTEIYTLSLHDALPIFLQRRKKGRAFLYTPSFTREQFKQSLEEGAELPFGRADRKSTRLNSSHLVISYAVFCL